MTALPPPEILAHLTGPKSTCSIIYTYTDAESGDLTSARCGSRRYAIAAEYHGDTIRRLSPCAVMLMTRAIRFPRLFHVSNCHDALKVREIGKAWTGEVAASKQIAWSRIDRVTFYPQAQRPACYRVAVIFAPRGKPTNTRLLEGSALRCAR